jgi:hypothetical protein
MEYISICIFSYHTSSLSAVIPAKAAQTPRAGTQNHHALDED